MESKVTTIKESKDLTSLSFDELIRNLKVHEMIIKKDSEIVKAKVKRKSLALKAKKESGDKECSTFESKDEEYAIAVRDFKKFFKRRGKLVRQPWNEKKTFQRRRDDKNGKSDRKYFRCSDPNHLIGECPKPPKDKNQRTFFGGSWSDSGEEDDEKVKNETCLVAQVSSEKEVALAISTTEAEYVSAEKACQQSLWMKQALVDYGISWKQLVDVLDHKMSSFLFQFAPSSLRAYQPVPLVVVDINESLRVFVWSVRVSFSEIWSCSIRFGDVDLILITFNSKLKIFDSLLNNQTSGENS
nr:retrovirus-related Pol polyprotein from transposon TNT 1-94 [Tanacetum cinerariifolium]